MDAYRTEFAEVYKFRFGAPVLTQDGELGSLASVVVDAAQTTLTAIGVKMGFFGGTFTTPIDQVESATADETRLKLDRAQLEQFKDKLAAPTLTSGTVVTLNNKRVGKLTQLTTHAATGVLRHLVIDRGLGGEALAPARGLTQMDGRQIALTLDGKQAHSLIAYRPDAEIEEEIRRALENSPRLRVDLPGIAIHVIDGVVWLKGSVASDLTRRMIDETLADVAGIDTVHNELIADNMLAAAISSALARDPRTSDERVGVYPRLGTVYLRGRVRSDDARANASVVAGGVKGVKRIVNNLAIDPTSGGIPELASVTNNEDLVPGGR